MIVYIVKIKQYYMHAIKNEEVIIEEGVEVISDYAFCLCSNLKILKLPDTLKEIKTWFLTGTEISNVKLGKNVNKIKQHLQILI